MKEGAHGPLAREGGLSSDILFAGTPEFLVSPLLMRPVLSITTGGLKTQSAAGQRHIVSYDNLQLTSQKHF